MVASAKWTRGLAWTLIGIGVGAFAAGWAASLYESFGPFDELLHIYGGFAAAFALAVYLYGRSLGGARHHPLALLLTVGCLGLAVGGVWEMGEWVIDALFGAETLVGLTDTIGDLLCDLVGGLLGGGLTVLVFRRREGRLEAEAEARPEEELATAR